MTCKSRKAFLVVFFCFVLLIVSPVVTAYTDTTYRIDPADNTTGVEGWLHYAVAGSWSSVHNAGGLWAPDKTSTLQYIPSYETTSTTDQFDEIGRQAYIINKSSIPNGSAVNWVKFYIYTNSKANGMNMTITGFTPKYYNDIIMMDYSNYTATMYSDIIPYASIVDGNGANIFTFNQTGIDYVSNNSRIAFMIRSDFDLYNIAPTWASSKHYYTSSFTSQWSGTTYDPKLVVNWSEPTGDTTPPVGVTNLANSTPTCKAVNFQWDAVADIAGVKWWLNNTLQTNTTNKYVNLTGLPKNTAITLSLKTYDSVGNLNGTFQNLTITTDPNCTVFVGVGDSLTNEGSDKYLGRGSYFGYVQEAQPRWEIYDGGHDGIGSTELAAYYFTDVYPNSTNYVIYENTNDIPAGKSFSDLKTLYRNYNITAAKNGTTVFFSTIAPNANYNAGHEAIRLEFNEWLRCNFTEELGNRYFVDWNKTLADPSSVGQMYPGYGDGVHLNGAGYYVLGKNISTSFPATSPVCVSPTPTPTPTPTTTVTTTVTTTATPTPTPTPLPGELKAGFTSNVTCGSIPFNVAFLDTSTGDSITDYFWDFGNYTNSTLMNGNNTYFLTGMYPVYHSVTNATGTVWKNESKYIRAVPEWETCPVTVTITYRGALLNPSVEEAKSRIDQAFVILGTWWWLIALLVLVWLFFR